MDLRRLSRFLLLLIFFLSYSFSLQAADDYTLGPDSQRQLDVPHGKVEKFTFSDSKIFPGTKRDYWVYAPAQYEPDKPACVMIFQDGKNYTPENGQWRVPVVFDNLIAKKEMPVTLGIFINPGEVPPAEQGQKPRSNRSFEYDSLGDQYARFLLEEILPEAGRKYNLTKDPEGRAIAGISF